MPTLLRSLITLAIGTLAITLGLTVSPHTTLANGDYICQILEGTVSATGGMNCNCTWGAWGTNGKRYCIGTRDPSVVVTEQIQRWGNTRIGCPGGPGGAGYHDGFRYGDFVSTSTETGPALSCQLEEIDGTPPFLARGTITSADGVLNPSENATFDLVLDDLESGVRYGSFTIRNPHGASVFARGASHYTDTTPETVGLLTTKSPTVVWQPAEIGTFKLEWSATDYAGNTSVSSFNFYVTDASIAKKTSDLPGGGGAGGAGGPGGAGGAMGAAAAAALGVSLPVCGNGTIENGEQCDDGNTNPSDQCSNTCTIVRMCSAWTPDTSTICGGKVIWQTNSCGGKREAIGTGAGDCAAPTTIPDPVGDKKWQGGVVRFKCIDAGTAGCATTYYTTDGSYPTSASPKYTQPISVPPDTIVRFFSIDKVGNVEDVKTEVYGAGSNIHIYGTIRATQAVSRFAKAESVGDLSLAEAKNLITRTTAPFQTDVGCRDARRTISGATTAAPASWQSDLTACERQNGNILLFDGTDVSLQASNDVATIPTGARTIYIRGGNLHLKSNVRYENSAHNSLGIIVQKDTNGIGGNVYIYPNVTNVVGAIYAEGTIQSVLYDDADPRGFIEGTKIERPLFLINQLLWEGTVISQNTIGGSESTTPYCPEIIAVCSAELAHQYDLATLRYLNRTTGKLAGQIVNGIDLPDPPGGTTKEYSIIVKYDTRVVSDPPPLFEGVTTNSTSDVNQ